MTANGIGVSILIVVIATCVIALAVDWQRKQRKKLRGFDVKVKNED